MDTAAVARKALFYSGLVATAAIVFLIVAHKYTWRDFVTYMTPWPD